MEWWQIVLLVALITLAALAIAAFVLWRMASERMKGIGERLGRLPWRSRFKLAWLLAGDERIPLAARAILPALVLYLAMPLDLVPDFIPLLGQLDDVVVVIVALALLTRFVPLPVIDAHLVSLEAEAGMPPAGHNRSS